MDSWEVGIGLVQRMTCGSDVTVVIPAYNNEKTISSTLDSLLCQEYDRGRVEIIVIDDSSTDETRQVVETYNVTKILNEKNIGLAGSLNKAILQAKYDIVVTLHADTQPVGKTWLNELVTPLVESDTVVTCSLQIPPSYSGRSLTIWEELFYAKFGLHNALNNKADGYGKTLLEKVGLFDEKTFMTAGEDEDMALRLRMHGVTIVGTKAKVMHNHFFRHESGVFRQILKKEFIFGKAGGALRRKYPFYKPGSYIFPESKSLVYDGLFRLTLCVGCLIPYVQMVSIPLLIIAASIGIHNVYKEKKKLVLIYPFFNIVVFAVYASGYIVGIFLGKQKQ